MTERQTKAVGWVLGSYWQRRRVRSIVETRARADAWAYAGSLSADFIASARKSLIGIVVACG